MSICKPEYTEDVQSKYKQCVELLEIHSARLSEAREVKRVMIVQEVKDGNDSEAPIKLSMMENEIKEATYKDSIYPEIHLTYPDKTEHENAWHTYIERDLRLENR